MTMYYRFARWFCVGLIICGTGCGKEEPRLGAVGGDLKFEGKPVDKAKLIFTSKDAAEKSGKVTVTVSAGHYELITIPAGSYKVAVALPDGVDPAPKDIPDKYQRPESSGLTVEVKASERTELNIEMTP